MAGQLFRVERHAGEGGAEASEHPQPRRLGDGTRQGLAIQGKLAADFPAIAPLLARSAVAIGDGYVTDDSRVPCGADVAIIPPVSGG